MAYYGASRAMFPTTTWLHAFDLFPELDEALAARHADVAAHRRVAHRANRLHAVAAVSEAAAVEKGPQLGEALILPSA